MKLTLGQVLALSLLGLAATLGLLFAIVLNESRATIIESSERIRDQASREISERVTSFLSKAPDTVAAFQRQIKLGLVDPNDPAAVESALFSLLLAKSDARRDHIHSRRTDRLRRGWRDPARRRSHDGKSVSSDQSDEKGVRAFVEPSGAPGERRFRRCTAERYIPDRIARRFRLTRKAAPWSPIRRRILPSPHRQAEISMADLLWSDLHWSQLDANQPQEQRDIEVSVQQTVADASDKFAGVIRVGLLAEQLDRAVQLKLTPAQEPDPHRIFLADRDGRLITRGVGSDRAKVSGEDLRIAPADLAPEIASALAGPELRAVSENMPLDLGTFSP